MLISGYGPSSWSNNVEVTGCDIRNFDNAIAIAQTSDVDNPIQGGSIHDNNFDNLTGFYVGVISDNVHIYNNTASNTTLGALLALSNNNIIEDNVIRDGVESACFGTYYAHSNIFRDNDCYNMALGVRTYDIMEYDR